METIYEGTWEEVAAHGPELAGRRVRLVVEEGPDEAAIWERKKRLGRALALLEEIGRGKGPYKDRVMDNDYLYPDDEERA